MVQCPGCRFIARVELVQVPAQPADHAGSLGNEVFAMINKQSHLTLGPVEAGDRQIGLAEDGARDGERIDWVALAKGASTIASVGHQLRWHPQDPLASSKEVVFEPTGEVPAILHRPQSLRAILGRPGEQLQMVARAGARRALRELPALLVDDNSGVAALVRVDPDDHHEGVSPNRWRGAFGIGRRAYPSWGDTTLLSSHAGRSHDVARAAQLTPATKAIKDVERARTTGSQ